MARDPSPDRLLEKLVGEKAISAGTWLVGDHRRVLYEVRAGFRLLDSDEAVGRWDRWDLASLSKPWTATLGVVLDRKGLLPLSAQVGEVWQGIPPWLAAEPLEALLRHGSGLPAWAPLYRMARTPGRAVARILDRDEGLRPSYSDLGYILWARTAEVVLKETLEGLLLRHVLSPLGIASVGARPSAGQAIETSLGNDREVELAATQGVNVGQLGGPEIGQPQDGNARFLGGAAGHAGLFGTAYAAWRLGAEWLKPRYLLGRERVERALAGRGPYRLGWWRPSAAVKATRGLPAAAFGHNGFTGGSVWVDPTKGLVMVLLTHRNSVEIDPDPWRRSLHRWAREQSW